MIRSLGRSGVNTIVVYEQATPPSFRFRYCGKKQDIHAGIESPSHWSATPNWTASASTPRHRSFVTFSILVVASRKN